LGLWGSACNEALLTYPLKGFAYDETGDCLGEEQVIDVIEGVPGDTCDGVLCIESEETGTIFITQSCVAPDLYVDRTADSDGPCPLALAAWERGDDGLCE
jgi:hypothetical protein